MTARKFRVFSQCSLITAVLVLQLSFAAHAQDLLDENALASTGPVTFNFVSTPNILSVGSLSADAENDIWATSLISRVALHFNGSTWKTISMAATSGVNKVAVVSPTNVWTVGRQTNAKFSQIQHFNGATWSVVSSPHFAAGESLNSLKAISANNIFAVGSTVDNLNNRTPLIERFNGMTWSTVPVPHIIGGELFDIAIISPSDMWAVGGTRSGALTLHFNGLQWSQVPAPVAALYATTALASNNVWAVGVQLGKSTVIERWNGIAWKVVSSPNTGTVSTLNSISAISPSDIWAGGCNACGDVGGPPPLIEHWNGIGWSINPVPIEFGGVSGNAALTFPSSRRIFVGGFAFAQSGITPVILKGVEGQ